MHSQDSHQRDDGDFDDFSVGCNLYNSEIAIFWTLSRILTRVEFNSEFTGSFSHTFTI